MNTIFNLIENKASNWISQEKGRSQSVVGNLMKYIEKENKLREPQRQAIEVYLWLKFVGDNKKVSDIIRDGLLYDEETARGYGNYHTFGSDFTTQFLNQFFQDNDVKKLHTQLVNDPKSEKINWGKVLEELLHNYTYPNYLFSLPMGAGKTYLMACFIYLDLYFANLYKTDKRFAHNFIVLAPQASKTAILPSLQTIKNFNPEWILPSKEADRIKQIIQIEILDALSSQRKDKLQGNNPNLEKVNRISQTKKFGMVFITNAEKVVLEKYDEKDLVYIDPNSLLYDEKKASDILKLNELREKLSHTPFLGVILDEVHHSYGVNSEQTEKRLRNAVNILDQHKNVVSVLGLSGTPYVRHKVKIGNDEIVLNQIQDIVYNYYLNQGIGRFLKIPEIKKVDVKEDLFIKQALTDFFDNFDIKYGNGTKSKIVFYCPSIQVLNDKILPVIQEWYKKKRNGKEAEIFKFYTSDNKENKLPKDSLAIFNNLDKPYSDKRVILLVAIGTEGWDCKSLTAVVLPRQKTTKNFVLQTTCRCLREVENASQERALIYLEKENYKTLDAELQENYDLHISDLKFNSQPQIVVNVREPKLGKLKYKQVETRYQILSKKAVSKNLNNFDFTKIKDSYKYEERVIKGKIGKAGINAEVEEKGLELDKTDYLFNDFIYDLASATFGKFNENDLLAEHKKELETIFTKLQAEFDWIAKNPNLEINDVIKYLVAFLMDEIEYKKETITSDVEIELLEWQTKNPSMALYTASGALAKFMPKITEHNKELYKKHPEDLRDEADSLDPNKISFNYVPYKMDSSFEINALSEMLKIGELASLEVYYNGYKDNRLQSFYIQTPKGVYTPDFLILKRNGKKIDKILIVETKGEIYYDEEFKQKEQFVKNDFKKYNPNFTYVSFVDKDGDNDFTKFITELKNQIKSL